MKRIILIGLSILLFANVNLVAKEIKLIPYPNKINVTDNTYTLTTGRIQTNKKFKKEAILLEEILSTEFQIPSKQVHKNATITIVENQAVTNQEGYTLLVTPTGIQIGGSTSTGIFYAIQTLRQLISATKELPCVDIADYPTFQWRAFMLDDGRAFKGVAEVKKLLDEMALLKMNIFQWHLTEDQGWRIEIKKYPRLTSIGSHRDSTQINWYDSKVYDGKPLDGYYSQKEVKEIIKYATERHIQIIPEIEMPGHGSAAIAAYPWLGCTGDTISVPCAFGVQSHVFNLSNPKVLQFFCDVLDEVIDLFPSPIIHIGGDEVKHDQWNASAEMQNFLKENNLHSFAELQIWFTNYISKYLSSKGKRIMGWNDITGEKIHGFQGAMKVSKDFQLSKDAIVQFWQGNPTLLEKAAKQGYSIVNSFHEYTYLNYNHDRITPGFEYSFTPTPLDKAYDFMPIPDSMPTAYSKNIIGMSCQMWGEWIPTPTSMYKMVYPYWAAHAETGWTKKAAKNFNRFKHSLSYFIARWKDKGYLPSTYQIK